MNYFLVFLSTSSISLFERFLNFWEKFGQIGLFIYSIIETISPLSGVEFFFISLISSGVAWWWVATLATLGNAVGAYLLYFFLGNKKIYNERFSNEKQKQKTTKLFNKYGYLAIYIVAMTPIPFFIILLVASAAKMNFKIYMLSTILSRGFRFLVTAYIIHTFSDFNIIQIVLFLTLISIPIFLIGFIIKNFILPFFQNKKIEKINNEN